MLNKPILVVDDEAIVRESIRDWLVDAGYHVLAAETGEEAMELVKHLDFGVMVLDLRLPGMHGLDVLRAIKTLNPQIKSIIITAFPADLSREEAARLGVIDYLVKPVFAGDLETLIRETLIESDRDTNRRAAA